MSQPRPDWPASPFGIVQGAGRLGARCGPSGLGPGDGWPALPGWRSAVTTRAARARPEAWREAFAAALPEAHLRFFRTLELNVTIGDYLFVHAGLRPGVPLAAQSEDDLVWIRSPFLDHAGSFGKVVVHGHTPALLPVIRSNRIGIDTGAVFSDRLTALRLDESARAFLHT